MRSGPEALVIGVGNLLWADEGFGVRCVEHFTQTYSLPDDVDIMDGGTQGLSLVTDLAAAKRILIFDAVDAHLEPGELITVRDDDVPRFVAARKVSLHQTSMMEVLALAELMGGGPAQSITLIGCQPVDMEDFGGGLTDKVAGQIPRALQMAAEELTHWGFAPQTNHTPVERVMPDAVMQTVYESARPNESDAYRKGDARVLSRMIGAQD